MMYQVEWRSARLRDGLPTIFDVRELSAEPLHIQRYQSPIIRIVLRQQDMATVACRLRRQRRDNGWRQRGRLSHQARGCRRASIDIDGKTTALPRHTRQ